MTKIWYCLQDFCSKFVGNPATTTVSPLLGDTLETTLVRVAVSCVLVEQVEDTYKWDNVPHCEESKRVNSVGFCRALQVFLSPQEARIKTSEFSVRSCRASGDTTYQALQFTKEGVMNFVS